ncbi:MAG TPA: hypothetical protein VF633_09370 [Brevundimonas sp.]|jgi:hypothetical protein
MTCDHEPDEHDYRALTATGNLTAFLHRHNRALIIIGAVAVVAAVAAVIL